MSTPSPWDHFTMEELTCHCGCGRMEMNDAFMQKLVAVRKELGFPLRVTSAFRCENSPYEKNKKKPGTHNLGRAVDITISYANAIKFLRVAFKHDLINGLGVYQPQGKHDVIRFIHVDDCDERIWHYL